MPAYTDRCYIPRSNWRWTAGELMRCLLIVILALAPMTTVQGEDLSPEVQALITKAQAGDPDAQFRLATAYDWGRGAPRNGTEAMKWYRMAAERGHAEAQNSVGSGLQAAERYGEALPWYQRAAEQNHALAINNLAYLYDLGLGVKQNRQKAYELYSRAADLGWRRPCGTSRTCMAPVSLERRTCSWLASGPSVLA